MMTVSPITSEQFQHWDDMLARILRHAHHDADPGREGMQRLFGRGGEFEDWFVAGFCRFTSQFPDYTLARSILGGDFINVEEVMVARPDIVYNAEQIVELAKTIPPEEVLLLLKENGYGLMPKPPSALSPLDIRGSKDTHFYTKTCRWYESVPFTQNDLTGTGWLAVKKVPVNGSMNKNWKEQKMLLSSVEYVPKVAEMNWFVTIFFEVRGVPLFADMCIRTFSIDSYCNQVDVGYFDGLNLILSYCWDDGRFSNLGIASAWKL